MESRVDINTVQSFKNGNQNAFSEIYELYYKKIYFFAYRYCYDEELSKDIVQSTFMEVYKSRENLRKMDSFYSWMLSIAYRQVIKCIDKEVKKKALLSEMDDIENLALSSQDSINKEVEYNEIFRVVSQSIELMKPKFKEVATLRYYYELSTNEIADVLSIAAGTAKSRVYRVNKIIQNDLRIAGFTPDISKSSAIFATFVPGLITIISGSENIDAASTIMNQILNNAGKVSAGGVGTGLLTSKLALGGTVATGVIVVCSIWGINVNNNQEWGQLNVSDLSEEVTYDSKIKVISYNSDYTNEPIQITVDTTNNEYDQILVNGSENLTITKNGTYEITLLKEGKVIDTKEIEITNFDTEAPKLINVERNQNTYRIELEDEQSNLNYNTIKYYYNGELSNNYTVNKEENSIYFEYQEFSSNIFYVADNAGNWREVKVVYDNI